jgi:hypothetical protein
MSKKFTYYGSTASAQFIMDLVPNAFFGISLKRLRAAYAGSCIRVRRSNDNTQTDIGFSGNNLDTAALLSFVGIHNAFIVTWYDQSGNGFNVTNATSGQQPQIVSSGSLLFDASGNLGARYDGTNDRLVSSAFTLRAQPYTAYGVWQGLNSGIEYGLDGSTTNRSSLGNTGAGNSWRAVSNSAADYTGGTYTPVNRANLPIFQFSTYNGASSRMNINNFLYVTANNPGTTGIDRVTIGANANEAGQFWNGFISEVVLFDGDKLADLPTVQTNVFSNYTIPL